MLYFDAPLIANSKAHARWFDEVNDDRDFFHEQEERIVQYEGVANAAAVLPRDAWLDMDNITRRVMRADEGAAWMKYLMPLAKTVNIGKIVHLNRVSSDAGTVIRSISGQVPVPLDKVAYDYRGTPVPLFHTAYGREWREWNSLTSEGFDALADDQEAHTAKLRRDMALYALNGDTSVVFQGYQGYGIRTHPLSKSINVGASGNNINLATATADALDTFFTGPFGAMLDANLVTQGVVVFISPEIARGWDRTYSGSAGFKSGTIMDFLLTNRRIKAIEVSYELSGNEFFAFVDSSEYIRPLIGMAANTTAIPRDRPRANYQFDICAAMGLEIRADFNGKSGVFYSIST